MHRLCCPLILDLTTDHAINRVWTWLCWAEMMGLACHCWIGPGLGMQVMRAHTHQHERKHAHAHAHARARMSTRTCTWPLKQVLRSAGCASLKKQVGTKAGCIGQGGVESGGSHGPTDEMQRIHAGHGAALKSICHSSKHAVAT